MIFGTLLQVANASGRSVIVDDVRVDDITYRGRVFRMDSYILADVTDTRVVHLPVWRSDVTHVLPIIMKQDTVTIFALEVSFEGDSDNRSDDYIGSPTATTHEAFKIRLRLNGTYRRYSIDYRRPQRVPRGFMVYVNHPEVEGEEEDGNPQGTV
jgi:hypothetical protein